MKSAENAVAVFALLFTLFGMPLAHAQSQLPTFKHVIIVIQENRTPDNLFGGIPAPQGATYPFFEEGVDLAQPPGGPWCLGACFDPNHENSAWVDQYNGGGGNCNACLSPAAVEKWCNASQCNGQPVCYNDNCGSGPYTVPSCPQSTFVSPTYDGSVIQPYVSSQHSTDSQTTFTKPTRARANRHMTSYSAGRRRRRAIQRSRISTTSLPTIPSERRIPQDATM